MLEVRSRFDVIAIVWPDDRTAATNRTLQKRLRTGRPRTDVSMTPGRSESRPADDLAFPHVWRTMKANTDVPALARLTTCGTRFALLTGRGRDYRRGDSQQHLLRVTKMQLITQMPVVVAAAQYSLIYLLLGGGFGGAVVIYIVAKVLGK